MHLREVRSNSLIIDDRTLKKVRKRQASVGTLSLMSPLSKTVRTNTPDPVSYVTSVPVINVPTPEYLELHRKFCLLQINKALGSLERMIRIPTEKIVEVSMRVSTLIQDTSNLEEQRKTYIGRGLNENREKFFLIHHLNELRIRESTLKTRDYEENLKYLVAMQNYLQDPPNFTSFHISINLNGYIASIPHHKDKLIRVQNKIQRLQKVIKPISYTPIPDEFEEQLIYPTSSTFSIFDDIRKNAANLTIEEVHGQMKDMTDDWEELSLLMDHAFTFAWQNKQFPFLNNEDDVPTLLDKTVRSFDPPYVPEKYLDLTVNELRYSGWPYQPVVEILDDIFYEINPIKSARTMYEAMEQTARCVAIQSQESVDVDFDTLFPLIMLSVLSSGLLSDSRTLRYVAMVSTIGLSDTYVNLGASYAEAILAHIRNVASGNIPTE